VFNLFSLNTDFKKNYNWINDVFVFGSIIFLRMIILGVAFILCQGTYIFFIVFYECIYIKKIVSIISMERRNNTKFIFFIVLYSKLISQIIPIQVYDYKEMNEGNYMIKKIHIP
jgi:hypothetical protein